MPFIGSIIPANIVGLGRDLRRARQKRDEAREEMAADAVRRGADGAQLTAPAQVTDVDRTERTPANESERSREDHAARLIQGDYVPRDPDGDTARPRIDLEG